MEPKEWVRSVFISRVILARLTLVVFIILGLVINLFSQERIDHLLHSIPYRCPLKLITGWKCAFCGMTHSWIAILRGDFLTAFHENLFGVPLFLLTVFLLIIYSLNKKIGINLKSTLMASIVLLFVYAIFRNLH